MRTRLIRPQFFSDETLAGAAVATRLFYIGLWTLCDDAGYFELRPREIAAALFPYDGLARRAKLVSAGLDELVELGRVELLACGLHGTIPTLPRHGQKGGNQSYTIRERHKSERVRTDTDKSSSESVSDSSSGSVPESDSLGADALKNAALAAGGFAANVAARKH